MCTAKIWDWPDYCKDCTNFENSGDLRRNDTRNVRGLPASSTSHRTGARSVPMTLTSPLEYLMRMIASVSASCRWSSVVVSLVSV